MKKILAIILVATMAFAVLPSISAQEEFIPGAPMFEDCSSTNIPIGTFSLAPGQQGEIASFNIPAKICPSVKKIQMGGFATTQGLPIGLLTQLNTETDSSVLDRGGYSYTCYYTGPCECVAHGCGRTIMINLSESLGPSDCLQVEYYTNQGISKTISINYYGLWADLPYDIVRIVIRSNGCELEGTLEGTIRVYDCCCYECIKEKNLPATILYPKVDIETFSVPGGDTVIQDGKVISAFEMSPGSQQVLLQVENRGFFTQNEASIRFDELPNGITVEVTPETQKIKAHNSGTYSATFTVGSNVPSGKYQVTMVAYSPNGMFDKITFEFVVQ